jgi:hypothetical protein
MYGNRLGWMISTGIIVLTATLLLMLARMDTISPPTAFASNPANLAALSPLGDPTPVLVMDQPGDAAEHYRKAIAVYTANEKVFRKLNETKRYDKAALPAMTPAFEALKRATKLNSMALFSADPAAVMHYDSTSGDLPKLKAIGDAAIQVALHTRDERPAESKELNEAVFGLGHKLYNERVTWDECWAGIELMSMSNAALQSQAKRAGDKEREAAHKAFGEQLKAFAAATEPMQRVLRSPDRNVMGRHVGDVFVIADKSAERMWRVEAIRKLGIIRYAKMTGKRKGDQLGALRVARRYATDPDPTIAAAGKAASELTLPEFNMVGR